MLFQTLISLAEYLLTVLTYSSSRMDVNVTR